MKGVSGVRGLVGTDLTPEVVARYAAAFGRLARERGGTSVVLARDSRSSGPILAAAVQEGLHRAGLRVIDCGLVATPTAQLAVEHHGAAGGIIVTASHNPIEWNALKFVGPDGLFLEREAARRLFAMVDGADPSREDETAEGTAPPTRSGSPMYDRDAVERHLRAILELEVLDVRAVRRGHFTVALDCVRGAGGTIMPRLLERLGCRVAGMDVETDGRFPRPPEPIPENLTALGNLVRESGAALGMAVDPDVDRLALVDETGRPIGEDYTLAFAVRTVLERRHGPVAINVSTSLVVEDAARAFGATVVRAPVGEANVARAMQRCGAVIGGEGNGGVMLPDLHLGRDAPLAAALVLDLLARSGSSVAGLVSSAPRYVIVKAKAPLGGDLAAVYAALGRRFSDAVADGSDGLRLAWPDRWLHVRPSGTEPVVRLIAEAPDAESTEALVAAGRTILEQERAA